MATRTNKKIQLRIVEERADFVKVEFPWIDIPVNVSQRYFKKLLNHKRYEIIQRERVA